MTDVEKQQLNNYIFAVAKGDMQALDGIFIIAAKRMTAVAYGILGNHASAEDVVSDSFVKIVKFAKKYRRGEEPMGWILRIVRNTALDFLRSRNRRQEIDIDKMYSLADVTYSYDRRAEAFELERAISKLTVEEQRAIKCRYFLDMTVRETAEKLGLTKSSADRLIKKAEENLKIILESGKKPY